MTHPEPQSRAGTQTPISFHYPVKTRQKKMMGGTDVGKLPAFPIWRGLSDPYIIPASLADIRQLTALHRGRSSFPKEHVQTTMMPSQPVQFLEQWAFPLCSERLSSPPKKRAKRVNYPQAYRQIPDEKSDPASISQRSLWSSTWDKLSQQYLKPIREN